MVRSKKNILILFLLVLTFGTSAQMENQYTQQERYEKLKTSEIRAIAENLDFDPRAVIRELNQILNDFYRSNTGDKKILQGQDVDVFSPFDYKVKDAWTVDSQRKFIKEYFSKPLKPELIREAENLFLAHDTIAQAYKNMEQPFKASYHFGQALRFRSLKLSPEIYTDEKRLSLLDQQDPQISLARAYQVAKTNRDTLATEVNNLKVLNNIIQDNIVSKTYEAGKDFDNICNEVKDPLECQRRINNGQLQQVLAQARALLARQKESNLRLLNRKVRELQQAEDVFQTHHEVFKGEESKWNKMSSKYLYSTAQLVKTIEFAIKERQKVLDKDVINKSATGSLYDYSQNRQFTAYANMLETASRLDPLNPTISLELGEEYKTSRLTDRAIYAFNTALQANQKTTPDEKLSDVKIAHTYRSLGALHFQKNHFVKSGQAYEKALEFIKEENSKANITFQLAKLHTTKTGNFERAEKLILDFEKVLKDPEQMTDQEAKANEIKKHFQTKMFLSEIYAKTSNPTKASGALRDAISRHDQLENLIREQRQKISKLFLEVQTAKLPLRSETNEADLTLYYQKKELHETEMSFLTSLESIRNSLPLKNIYFAYARYNERKHDIPAAIAVYQKAEKLGISPDQARRNMQRLRKR